MWIKRSAISAIIISPILLIGSAGVGASSEHPVPPSITVQPMSMTTDLEHIAHFEVQATGVPRPTFQWQVSTGRSPFVNVGVSSPDLSIEATFDTNGNRYRAVVSNSAATVYTRTATLTVDESQYVGGYTLDYTVGPYVNYGGTVNLLPDGKATDGSALDLVSWSVSGRTVTVSDGNDSGELLTFVGNISTYGIANPEDPGTVTLSIDGGGGLSGTFYAQRMS